MSKRRLSVSALALVTLASLSAALPSSPSTASTGAAPTAAPAAPQNPVLENFRVVGDGHIRLMVGAFDPLKAARPRVPAIPLVTEGSLDPSAPAYFLVQVRDRRFSDAMAAVAAAGALVVGNLPEDTYMVRATPAQRAGIASSPAVRWAGYYQPAWRVQPAIGSLPALTELPGRRLYRVHGFRDDPDPASVGRALRRIPGVRVIEDAGVVVDVDASAAQVPAMASVPAVEWVGLVPTDRLLNGNGRWVTDTGVRDVLAATRPGRLTGAGQTDAVADTAINYTYDLNGRAHVAFRDCNQSGVCKQAVYTQVAPGTAVDNVQNNATGHRKMVAFFDIGNTGPNPFDDSSHGSHTSGSVAGDAAPFGVANGEDGMAPGAMHVHQNIGTPTGGLAIPSDVYDLFRQAYRPRKPSSVIESSVGTGNPIDATPGCVDPAEGASNCYRPLEDARTHNNSWSGTIGGVVPDPTRPAVVDRFVWDHEDLVIVFSAGNAGPAVNTFASPSQAKNDISSGASANGRQPMASIDSMALFSSHGPTPDGRFGPDLATPGQIVVSVKGGTTSQYHVAQGTSMSAPILTGLSTLVRQYFFDGYAVAGGDGFAAGTPAAARSHIPSAALVRAAMVNGAVRMRGWYSGDDGRVRQQDGQWPSAGQGFGLVNLDNSLYFANDPTNNYYVDVFRGDTQEVQPDANLQSFPANRMPQSRTFQVKVEQGQPLDVTLSWTDAPSLIPAGSPQLVNDLNLEVTGPGGTTYLGNNMNSRANPAVAVAETMNAPAPPDTRNPTERVRIANPAAGTYTITVDAAQIQTGRQGFALAASGLISPVDGSFTPGPALQTDAGGTPTISGLTVTPYSADTAEITFRTSEPTTARAGLEVGGTPTTFVDSYNVGTAGFPGLDEGPVETSAAYGDKPVLGTKHEILLTGLAAGEAYSIEVSVTDLGENEVSQQVVHTSPTNAFQADADDIGQLAVGADPTGLQGLGWRIGTQLYAAPGLLGAYAFRLPQDGIDPATITGAAVTMVSAHNWVVNYTQDSVYTLDLLNPSVEPNWGTQNYEAIDAAPATARVYPETSYRAGNYEEYAFTFRCGDLERLRETLTANRMAAFRWESTDGGNFSMDFGFNRRSRGPELRPRLLLFTEANPANPTGEACDPGTPAPTISDVGVHSGVAGGSTTVTWRTNVDSDSMVLFREQGTTPWTQVGTPARTKIHQVEVFGLDETKDYEFVVRSETCNGRRTTDTNGGEGYAFFYPPVTLSDPTVHASYDFETGDEGWTTETNDRQDPDQPVDTMWARGAGGHQSQNAFHASPYHDQNDAYLKAPPVTFTGAVAQVEFFEAHDLEQPPPGGLFTTSDALQVERSVDGGTTWNVAAVYQGQSPGYPAFTRRVVTIPNTGQETLIRFNLTSDDNISFPPFEGADVDKVSFLSATPTGGPPPGTELPLTGPIPAPSAGATNLTAPRTRTGSPSAADVAAGTGACAIPGPETSADLSLTATAPATADVRHTVRYLMVVKNEGEVSARDVTLTHVLIDQLVLRSATVTRGEGSCSGTQTITCDLGTVRAGREARVYVKAWAVKSGTVETSAGISSSSPDRSGGNDTATTTTEVSGESCTIIGTRGPNTLTGTDDVDIICGAGGNDVLNGMDGNDSLYGMDGNDQVNGGDHDDLLQGGTGNDQFNGGPGEDTVSYFESTPGVGVSVDLAAGTGGGPAHGSDTIVRVGGVSTVENVTGTSGSDTLSGNAERNKMVGLGGPDDLFGREGNDVLTGGFGNDDHFGGPQRDTCSDQEGTNTFDSCERQPAAIPSSELAPWALAPDGTLVQARLESAAR